MEGMLWKWTNYFNGWQLRWFVLHDGILSYYKSHDDVNNGCKGSVKMTACDVSVHATDQTRLDLIIPGEAHFYIKASSAQERQQWLVALGTAKACHNSSMPSSPSLHSTRDEEPLKIKKSELRLYCDLLMQQVHSVKCAVQNKQLPDIEQLNESTSLLSATCDTFIKTLDECVTMAHAKLNSTSSISSSVNGGELYDGNGSNSPSQLSNSSMANPWNQNSIQRNALSEKYIPGSKTRTRRSTSRSISESSDRLKPAVPSTTHTPPTVPRRDKEVFYDQEDDGEGTNGGWHDPLEPGEEREGAETDTGAEDVVETRLPTFFTNMKYSFLDVRLTTNMEVPTVPFLDACRSILPIFDKLNDTAFIPAKLDIVGNIKKIHQKYLSAPDKFQSLQSIVAYEVNLNQCHLTSSATMAILWLNRTLEFIRGILDGLQKDTDDLAVIVNDSYTRTLCDYHGWVIRGAFAMAVRSAPTKTALFQCLAVDDAHCSHAMFRKSVLLDMADHSSALSGITTLIHTFLDDNNLNFPDQV